MSEFKIAFDAHSFGTVEVDGQDVSKHVVRLFFEAEAGKWPRLVLDMGGALESSVMHGEVVYVVVAGAYGGRGPTPRQAVLDLLRKLPAQPREQP